MADAKRRSRTLKGQADVLLGWSKAEAPRSVGFAPPAATLACAQDATPAPIVADGEGHLLTVAPTGAGKGRGAVVPNLLRYDGPAVVVDPKGEAAAVTARARRAMGQTVHVLDPFAVTAFEPASLNPLDAVTAQGADFDAECRALAHTLSGARGAAREPFWDTWGKNLLAGVIALGAASPEPAARTLPAVRQLLKHPDVLMRLAAAMDGEAGPVPSLARAEIGSFLNLVEQTRSGVLATAQSFTEALDAASARASFWGSSIDLDAVTAGAPMTIYLVVPPDKLAAHAALVRVWIATLLRAAMARRVRPDRDTLFLVDEAGQLGGLEELRTAMTLLRGYGVRTWAFFQDLSQLRRAYPDDWATLLNNARALQAFGATTHTMAAELADLLGDVDADALRRMGPHAQAVARAGAGTVVCRRPDYLSDAAFAGRYDANPRFAVHEAEREGRLL